MNIFEAWQKARPILEPALEEAKGTHTIDDVCLMVGKGHFTLWVGEKSAMLTEFVTFPRMKALNVFIGGGDLSELRKMEDEQLGPFAKQQGCSRITGAGRKGWTKTLPGYTFAGIYMHKDL